jgi:hypothetical protein
MRGNFLFTVTTAIALVGSAALMGNSQAAPIASLNSIRAAAAGLSLTEDAQFFFGGYDYCWYWDGWHGPGWYVCDYGSWVSGSWWGGPRGWHGWVWHGGRHDEHRERHGKQEHRERHGKQEYHKGKAPSYVGRTSKSMGAPMSGVRSGGGGGGGGSKGGGGGGRGGKH